MVALAALSREGNLFREGASDNTLDKRPYMEHLIDLDQVSFQLKPMLATKRWSVNGILSRTWSRNVASEVLTRSR